MKNLRKIFAAALCFAVIFTALPVFANDMPSFWAQEEIEAAISEGLVPENLRYNYTQPITRAEFSALAVRLYEAVSGEITGRTTFADTNDINVEKLAYINVVFGVGGNRFDPDGTLTREQAALILSRLVEEITGEMLPISGAAVFADTNSISPWAAGAVLRITLAGIMIGVDENNFAPRQPYTREQAIVTILRTLEFVGVEGIGKNMELEFALEYRSRRIWIDAQWGQNIYALVRNVEELQRFAGDHIHSRWGDGMKEYFLQITDKFDDNFLKKECLFLCTPKPAREWPM